MSINELPTTWQRIAPHLLAALGLILGYVCAGIQTNPDWYQSVGISSGAAAVISVILAQIMSHFNERKSAKAMPAPAVAPNGRQLTRCEDLVNLAITAARANGDKALADHLNAAPIALPARVER